MILISEKFISDSLKLIRNGNIAIAFKPEQITVLRAQCKLKQIKIRVSHRDWFYEVLPTKKGAIK